VNRDLDSMENYVVRSVEIERDHGKVSILQVADSPGVAARLFSALSDSGINVDLIIQNVSEDGLSDITFTVPRSSLDEAAGICRRVSEEIGCRSVDADAGIAKVSVCGVGMRSHPGVAAWMFGALAEAGINIEMISSSEIKISCVVRDSDAERAEKVVADAFEIDAD